MLLFAVFFVFFIMMLVFSSMGNEKSVVVKKNSVLTINLKTDIIDSPTEENMSLFNISDKNKSILLYDVLEAIHKAKTDDNIKGISIEADHLNAGITQLDDIRSAIEDFKKSGKFVYAYGNAVSQSSYYLGSVADQYYLNPSGMIELKGLATEVTFFKDFAEKYGIGVEVIRHGKFKSAVEPFLRNDISPENKEQLQNIKNYPPLVEQFHNINQGFDYIDHSGFAQMPIDQYDKWLGSLKSTENKQKSEEIAERLRILNAQKRKEAQQKPKSITPKKEAPKVYMIPKEFL